MPSESNTHQSGKRPKYLFVLASTCQMYSGTGTAIFNWVKHTRDQFEFHFLIDNLVTRNVEVTRAFCAEYGVALHISRFMTMPGCPDAAAKNLPLFLEKNSFDFIECISWANAATNMSVLASNRKKAKLVFTPHSQPLWTLPDNERFPRVSPTFTHMLCTADATFIDSPAESTLPEFGGVPHWRVHFVPLGVDTGEFCPGDDPVEPFRMTCVCDCNEPRKRIDLLLAAFTEAHRRDPRLRLVLAGRGSKSLQLSPDIENAVERLGYITPAQLLSLYRTSSLFVLISDYEAFGFPIAEALCCGTPVLVNDQPAVVDLFGGLPGVTITHNADVAATAARMVELCSQPRITDGIASAAAAKFSFAGTYGRKRDILMRL